MTKRKPKPAPAKKTAARKAATKKVTKGKKTAGKASKKAAAKVVPRKPTLGKKAVHAPSRQELFVREYLVDLNGRQAAIRAGYSPGSARQTASELLATPDVQAAVQKAMDERATRTGITAERVLERIWGIATADPRELIELVRSCCRNCYGKQHKYQRTAQELKNAWAEWRKNEDIREDKGMPSQPFDTEGGTGYDPRRDPHPHCPECFGDGVERVIPKDTRDLAPDARMLYAGVKTTQHGLEIKMHDQTAMLVHAGRHLGLFKERLELSGKNGGPVQHSIAGILDDIDGAGTGLPDHATRGS